MTSQPSPHLIGKILAPALQLWLRSQLDGTDNLEISISGRNREILRGYIPSVSLAATRAIYQGLHFSQVQFAGNNIRINLPQVLKGQPLCLLETIAVSGEALLEQADLQASLASPLLQTALKDLLSTLIAAAGTDPAQPTLQDWQIDWQNATIANDRITFQGIVTNLDKNPQAIGLSARLALQNESTLRLHDIAIEASSLFPALALKEFNIDLGSDVKISSLESHPGRVSLQVAIAVNP